MVKVGGDEFSGNNIGQNHNPPRKILERKETDRDEVIRLLIEEVVKERDEIELDEVFEILFFIDGSKRLLGKRVDGVKRIAHCPLLAEDRMGLIPSLLY